MCHKEEDVLIDLGDKESQDRKRNNKDSLPYGYELPVFLGWSQDAIEKTWGPQIEAWEQENRKS